jgi:hypothetical protein
MSHTATYTDTIYYTVVVPPAARIVDSTKWHSYTKTLTRGAFDTPAEAHAWAKKKIPGNKYTVRKMKGAVRNPSKKSTRAANKRYSARQRSIWSETPGDVRTGSLAGGSARVMRLGPRGTYMAALDTVRNPCYGLHIHSKDLSKVMKAKGRKCGCNPSKGSVDYVAATELALYADNDYQLYQQQREPIEKNLLKKWQKGTYDSKKAVKLWSYLMESAAKKYHKEFGGSGKWYDMFNVPTRMAAAKEAAELYESTLAHVSQPNPAPASKMTRASVIKAIEAHQRKVRALERRATSPSARAKAVGRRAVSKLRSMTPSARRQKNKRIDANLAAARARDAAYNPAPTVMQINKKFKAIKPYVYLSIWDHYDTTSRSEPHHGGISRKDAVESAKNEGGGVYLVEINTGGYTGVKAIVVGAGLPDNALETADEWTAAYFYPEDHEEEFSYTERGEGPISINYVDFGKSAKSNPGPAATAIERVQYNKGRRAKYAKGAGVRNLIAASMNPGGGTMSKKDFESMFKTDLLPMVVDDYEMDGVPDGPARREMWNDTVDFYLKDGMLPAGAENWSHPRWLETHVPKGAYMNPPKRKKAATKKRKTAAKKRKGGAKKKRGAAKRKK